MPPYRADIDGLRAVAVSSVVLFHAGARSFGGGFLGVDIFFVISGFLITQILMQREAGSGLVHFYERRIRRILPALTVLLAVTGGGALLLDSPHQLRTLASTMLAATGFVTNVYFNSQGGYYGAVATDNPLLHLWSLAVEEQFYIFFPLLMWLVQRHARHWLAPLFTAGFAGSLALSVWLLHKDHTAAAFYSTLSRDWELLLGALAALVAARTTLPRPAAEIGTAAGLVVISASVLLFSEQTAWPGLHALIPTIAAALLLVANARHKTWSGRLLGQKPLVMVGLVSYSLYLWHWPLFVFYGDYVLRPIAPAEYAGLIALSAMLAWLSWRFVERPFRTPRRISRGTVFHAAAASCAILLLLATTIHVSNGFPQRFSPAIQRADALLAAEESAGRCFADKITPYDYRDCFRTLPDRPNLLLWGDSFSANIAAELHRKTAAANMNLIQASYSGCGSFLEAGGALQGCRTFNRNIAARLGKDIAAVILLNRIAYPNQQLPALYQTVRTIARKGIAVIVMGSFPAYYKLEPLYVERFLRTGNAAMLDSSQFVTPEAALADGRMRAMFANQPGVTYISVLGTACPSGRCPMMVDGAPAAFDNAHLTAAGSHHFTALLWPGILKAISSPPPGR